MTAADAERGPGAWLDHREASRRSLSPSLYFLSRLQLAFAWGSLKYPPFLIFPQSHRGDTFSSYNCDFEEANSTIDTLLDIPVSIA